jgi:hypothetical protein
MTTARQWGPGATAEGDPRQRGPRGSPFQRFCQFIGRNGEVTSSGFTGTSHLSRMVAKFTHLPGHGLIFPTFPRSLAVLSVSGTAIYTAADTGTCTSEVVRQTLPELFLIGAHNIALAIGMATISRGLQTRPCS